MPVLWITGFFREAFAGRISPFILEVDHAFLDGATRKDPQAEGEEGQSTEKVDETILCRENAALALTKLGDPVWFG
jgi:hypothetical protein